MFTSYLPTQNLLGDPISELNSTSDFHLESTMHREKNTKTHTEKKHSISIYIHDSKNNFTGFRASD